MNSRIETLRANRHVYHVRALCGMWLLATSVAFAESNEATATVAAPRSLFTIDPDSTVFALSAVFILVALLTFYVGVLYFRERRRQREAEAFAARQTLLPSPVAENSLATEAWHQRALAAEALADNQALILREKLMPELTEFVKQSLVQGLAAQRDALLAMQQQAMQSLVEFEARLNALQAPMQDRIRAYETRIAELEREITAQGAEMRELTRALLELMRKKLEDEQRAQPVETLN